VSEPPRPPGPPGGAPPASPGAPPPSAAPPPGQPPATEPEPPPPPPIEVQLLGDALVGHEQTLGQLILQVSRERLIDACATLRDDPQLRYDHLSDVTAVDYLEYNPAGGPPGEGRTPRFDVVYHLYSIGRGQRVRLKVALDEDDTTVPSVTGLWAAANWAERETYDMYGIEFGGHPNMTRILMPDDWQGHPLRRDYPLIEEEIEFTSTLDRLNERRSR
jgi:NADH-quinone oxidoreductase subunit C